MQKNFLQQGFSVVEVLLACALLLIFATGAMTTVLQGFDINRLSQERTIATAYATEGIEAVRSIRNQSYAALVDSSGEGLTTSTGLWAFAGSNNQFGPNNKYTRVVSIADVLRDSNGNIVASGGTLDPNTKKVTSTVTWQFNPARMDSVMLSTYLTNWRASTVASESGCLVINTSAAARNHKFVQGITLKNSCGSAITISKFIPHWNTANNIVTLIINGTTVWSSSGPGTPTGDQPSGTTLTLQPISITQGATVPLTEMQMLSNVLPGTNWSITFILSTTASSSAAFTTP